MGIDHASAVKNFIRFFKEHPPNFAKSIDSTTLTVGGRRYNYDDLASVDKLFDLKKILDYDLTEWWRSPPDEKIEWFKNFVESTYRHEMLTLRQAKIELKSKLTGNGKAELMTPDADYILSHLHAYRFLGDKKKEAGFHFWDTKTKSPTPYDYYSIHAALRSAGVDKETATLFLDRILHCHECYNPHGDYGLTLLPDTNNVYLANQYVLPDWRKLGGVTPELPSEIDRLMQHLFPAEECRDFVYTWIYHSLTSRCGTYLYLVGGQGCLAGDTFIPYSTVDETGRIQDWKGGTLKRLYERFNKLNITGRGRYQHEATFNSKFVVSSMDDDGFIFKNDIEGVVYSGVKECFRVTTQRGLQVVGTADHKFFVGDRYVPLGQLSVGDTVMVHDNVRYTGDDGTSKPRNRYAELMVKYHSAKRYKTVTVSGGTYTYCRVRKSRAVVEAHLNGLSFDDYVEALNTWPTEKIDNLRRLPRETNVHHLNEDHRDDRLENLMLVDHADHAREHAKSHNRLKLVVVEDQIVSIERVGDIETYDIQCRFPFNNFVADGFVVHNSGKNTLARIIQALHGLPNTSNPKQDSVSGRFNQYLKNKSFVFFDEFSCRNRQDKDTLKRIINDRIQIEGKHRDHEDVRIYASFLIANNVLEALGIDPVDRRFSVPDVTNTSVLLRLGADFIGDLLEKIKDPAYVAAFGHWILSNFKDPKWGPETPYQKTRFEEIVLSTARAGIAEVVAKVLRREQRDYTYDDERDSFKRTHKGHHYPSMIEWTKFFREVKKGGEPLGKVDGQRFIPAEAYMPGARS